jgi:hypothetical protein
MTPIYALWLPILVSAVFVFIVSAAIHMVSSWHRSDYGQVPNEDRVMEALRPFAIPPGDYMLPKPAGPEDMRTPAFADKVRRGPVIILTVLQNRMMAIGQSLAMWFVFCCVVGFFSAYVAGSALPPGAHYLKVFQLVGTTAFAGYAFALWPISIWYHRSWTTTIKSTIDGLLFALLTAGTTGWLWPR